MIRAIATAVLSIGLAGATAMADVQSPTGVASLEGRRLDTPVQIKFRDTDLAKVFEVIGRFADVTFDVPADLHYRVSFEMVGVSARRALQVIGESQSLSYRQEGRTILVQRMGAGDE